jgi:hypothetical protein
MTDRTHQAAPTQCVDGAGMRFAYRCFGKNETIPFVFFQHFTRLGFALYAVSSLAWHSLPRRCATGAPARPSAPPILLDRC